MAEVAVKTISNGVATLDEDAIAGLDAGVRGEVIRPGDVAYDEARTIYNAMIDKHPALIVRCRDTADVIMAVNFAREHDVLLAVRGGGHNGPGLSLCDEGLVIDLSLMKGIRVDPEERTVRVEPGCCWGDVDHATHVFGQAVPTGIVSTTGVPGLTLGGGHGYLARKYGLTIDNLLEADVVLADGRLVTAGPGENEDLFWAIRGGGGNFGVVTSFLFRTRPVDTVYAGVTLWPFEQTANLMRWYRDFLPKAPRELYGFLGLLTVPPGPPFPEELHLKKVCGIVWCYTGPQDKADEAFKPVWDFGQPAFKLLGPMPMPALNSMFDALYPPGQQWYWKGDFVNELSDEAIEAHLKHGADLPTPQSTMHLYPIDGAVHDISPGDSAWRYRDTTWSMVIVGVDPDPAKAGRLKSWVRDYWKALHPYSAGGAYVNFMMDEADDRVRATYGDNYDRLVAVKTKYDPGNLFRVNWNIQPKT